MKVKLIKHSTSNPKNSSKLVTSKNATIVQLPLKIACFLVSSFAFVGCGDGFPEEIAEAYAKLPERVDYNFDVKPILSDKCFACHGPDPGARRGDLRLDLGANDPLLSKAEHATRGRALNGELLKRILSHDPDLIMPPPESQLTLTDRERAILAKWVRRGGEHQSHWAFRKPETPTPPSAANWGMNPIDGFVYERLTREGLQPAPAADPATMARRASFALAGLPPSPELLEDFKADTESGAYDRLIDKLLASPAYGERMATHWMDVARYADSDGYLDDKHRRLWPYRDWVINAFNSNLPYKDFVTLQLAGDLVPGADQETVLPTAFNRLHQRNSEAGIIFEEYRVEYVADRNLTLGKAFLGLSIECAQCHDHKYDPISQKDYFRTFAMFNSTAEIGSAVYGPDQTPGPSLLLSSGRQDSIIAFLKERITDEESKLRYEEITAPDPARFTPLAYLSFDRVRNGKEDEAIVPMKYSKTKELKIKAPKFGKGVSGQAFFVTEDNSFTLPDSIGDFERDDAFSISLAIRPDTVYAESPVFNHNEIIRLGWKGYQLQLVGNRLRVIMAHSWPSNAIEIITKEAIPVRQWSRILITYDGSSRAAGFKLFVDGKQWPTETIHDNLYKGIVYEYSIHTYGYDGFVVGKSTFHPKAEELGVDDLRIFDFDLSARPADKDSYARLRNLRKRLTDTLNAIPEIMVMGDVPGGRQTYLLDRGMYDAPADSVAPGVPEAIMPWNEEWPRNRYGLAQWVTHPDNPLAARVFVNRIWELHFGRGLVPTTEDFGNQGGLPSHPGLLDWLAGKFLASGWDVKALHKLILTSATFRQESTTSPATKERDPNNELLARGPTYRLTAEMIRDNALAVSGLLVAKIGGPSVYPHQPAGLWDELSDKWWRYPYLTETGAGRYRRSLYTFRKRSAINPASLIFDAPDNSVCTVRRRRSNTPLQALVLLNNPLYLEAAAVLAVTVSAETEIQEERIRQGYERLLSRSPTNQEIELLLNYYQEGVDLATVFHSVMNTTDFYTIR